MDYVVGSVAALISGDVTPNRPRLIRRALTPTKHQQSPNVTPKSEFVDDRSIFLSPSLQKKKAIVKKSPKRIFQNPDLDVTNDGVGNSSLISPKADKVKKHLKEDLDADDDTIMSPKSPKSPKKNKGKLDNSVECKSPKKKISISENDDQNITEAQTENESTPKKKKKQRNSMPVEEEKENLTEQNNETQVSTESNKSSKKKRKSQNVTEENNEVTEKYIKEDENAVTPKKKRKNKTSESNKTENTTEESVKPENKVENMQQSKKKKKKNKKGKNKAKTQNNEATVTTDNQNKVSPVPSSPKKKNKKPKNEVNPNAITNKDSDSEHESDDEIQSENEQANNEILNTGPVDSSDNEEEEVKKQQKQEKKDRSQEDSNDEIKRTLFVGNVPFSKKCKKEIKKIFGKYGQIETVRVRAVPVKDARVTPKLAVIKNELHPERSTVNVYVKFQNASSVDAALSENNTVLNDHHLRVTRSDTRGTEHDPHKAIFVGNLPFAIEDETLRAKFESCGEVKSVRVVRDSKTNAGKGFGYVNFSSKDGVELALAMSEEDLTIKNRILRVKRCTDTTKKGPKPGNTQGKFQGNWKNQGRSQGMKQRNQDGNQGGFRNQGGRPQGGFGKGNFGKGQGFGEDKRVGQDGAHRRILKKRHNEEGGGPPNKRPNITQPSKEKKSRKEFVGMTAEKKKKHKFNKGDKKKKALSEILTKHSQS